VLIHPLSFSSCCVHAHPLVARALTLLFLSLYPCLSLALSLSLLLASSLSRAQSCSLSGSLSLSLHPALLLSYSLNLSLLLSFSLSLACARKCDLSFSLLLSLDRSPDCALSVSLNHHVRARTRAHSSSVFEPANTCTISRLFARIRSPAYTHTRAHTPHTHTHMHTHAHAHAHTPNAGTEYSMFGGKFSYIVMYYYVACIFCCCNSVSVVFSRKMGDYTVLFFLAKIFMKIFAKFDHIEKVIPDN